MEKFLCLDIFVFILSSRSYVKKEILEELKFEVGALSFYKNTEDKIVLGTGNLDGKVLFVGDDIDLYEGENFNVKNNSNGEFLIRLCDIVELEPEQYYITTLSKCKKRYREIFEDEKDILKEVLFSQIALINPVLIVALGENVAEILRKREINFLEERGKIEEWCGDIKLLVTYDVNFAKVSRDGDGKRSKIALEFWNDLKQVRDFIL